MFRTILQIGYTFSNDYLAKNNKIIYELKIGIGINTKRILRKNNQDSETSLE